MRSQKLLLCMTLFFWVTGCAVKNPRLEAKRGIIPGVLKEDKAYHARLLPEEYVIEESDQLQISVIGNPDLTRAVTVRSDGIVTYELIGSVPLAGLKVSAAEALMQERLVEYVKDARVSIDVTGSASKNIYVFGRVMSPGPQPFTGRNNVLDAVSRAGGVSPGASIQNILVVRQDKVNPRIIPVNFKELVKKGIATEDIRLKANDIVLVTPNIFGRVEEIASTVLLPVGPLTSPIFTLQSLDETFGLDLAGEDEASGGGTAASDFAATSAASTSTTSATGP